MPQPLHSEPNAHCTVPLNLIKFQQENESKTTNRMNENELCRLFLILCEKRMGKCSQLKTHGSAMAESVAAAAATLWHQQSNTTLHKM